jgi:YegS/Rv2252/BmrU family lipid kinase
MKRRRVLLLVNAKSRRGRELGDNLRDELRKQEFEVVNSRDYVCGEFGAAVEAHAGKVDCVAVGGGDGSMNASLEGLLKTKLPLGVIPLGTSNNLARNLGIPLDPAEAIRLIGVGEVRTIDLGCVNGFPFFNVAGMGLSIRVNRDVPSELKRRWGMLAYVATALKSYQKYRPFTAEIETPEGSLCLKSLQISVCNGRHFGSGLTVAEGATITDGKLHLASVQVEGWKDVPRLVFGMKTGRHGERGPTLLLESPHFSIKTRHSMSIDVDGEITTQTPAHFKILPDALQVVAPARIAVERAGVPANGEETEKDSAFSDPAFFPKPQSDRERYASH